MIRRTLIAVAATSTLLLTGCGGTPPPNEDGIEFEVEDCDREDALRGERECSQSQIDRARKSAKPTPSKTSRPKAPASKPKPASPPRRSK